MGPVPRAAVVGAPAAEEGRAAVVAVAEELAARRFPEMADSLVKAPGGAVFGRCGPSISHIRYGNNY